MGKKSGRAELRAAPQDQEIRRLIHLDNEKWAQHRRKRKIKMKMQRKSRKANFAIMALFFMPMTVLGDSLSGAKDGGFDWVQYAENEVLATYGDKVSVAKKAKQLFKFGTNTDIDQNEETVMAFQGSETSETYVNTNLINNVSSSNNSDTFEVTIEGHTCSGSGEDLELTFVTQSITLTGTTAASLTTPLCRATRIYNSSGTAQQSGSVVYVWQSTAGDADTNGIPDDTTKIHVALTESTKDNTSQKASTAISKNDYCFVTKASFGVNKKTTATADFNLKVRLPGKVFRLIKAPVTVNSSVGEVDVHFRPFLVVPKNSDVIITAKTSVNDTQVSAGFQCLLAIVQ